MKKARPGWIPVQERLPEVREVYRGGPKSDRRRKLTALQVDEIRRERRRGKKLRELATLYHVSEARISRIANGWSWKK